MPLLKSLLVYLMAFLYIAAGLNHFRKPEFYIHIMPAYLPAPLLINQLSGIVEIILGLLLFSKITRSFAALAIAIMLILFLAVHIYMLQQALYKPDYFMSPAMAWVRLLAQGVLIAWALWYRK